MFQALNDLSEEKQRRHLFSSLTCHTKNPIRDTKRNTRNCKMKRKKFAGVDYKIKSFVKRAGWNKISCLAHYCVTNVTQCKYLTNWHDA